MRGHIAILTGAAEQNVAKVMQRAALAEAVEKAVAHVGSVAHAELQQRARLLPLLHEPHAWQRAEKVTKRRNSGASEVLQLTHVHQSAGVVKRAQMRTGEREEGVQARQQWTHLWTRQCAAHNDGAQGMRYKGDARRIQATAVDMVENLGHQPARERKRKGGRYGGRERVTD